MTGIISRLVMMVMLVFADGPRRWYSSALFGLIGALMLTNAPRWRRVADN
ncbi:MAG: hypothetical protein PVF68_01310 [Acidobacteriota bacterium]